MASTVFTYDHNPPKVTSPWPSLPLDNSLLVETDIEALRFDVGGAQLEAYRIAKLESEPPEGPVEYKLHLLLRPRKKTIEPITPSRGHAVSHAKLSAPSVGSHSKVSPKLVIAAKSSQSKQERLLHLTTQLLWRLQQSSPLHSAAQVSLDIDALKTVRNKDNAELRPAYAAPGLEQSQGALYEIGVSDDGVLEGLSEIEMRESLATLQSMAASLGCHVVVRRLVAVGECELQSVMNDLELNRVPSKKQTLWAVEAFVAPSSRSKLSRPSPGWSVRSLSGQPTRAHVDANGAKGESEQLRVSLTGSTTSGKSSLLGTLSTSTLDNGRGKSRLSLLKHRHEITSGVTSSIVTEILGYPSGRNTVVNCALADTKSWGDVHAACGTGRIVTISDTAGHPRYRRTTVRSLVALKPHWTICCVAADTIGAVTPNSLTTQPSLEMPCPMPTDCSQFESHLELCLTLELPLVVVITKLDVTGVTLLRSTLNRILTILKAAHRRPFVLPSQPEVTPESGSPHCPTLHDMAEAKRVLASGSPNYSTLVPIILTSAVTGRGIGTLHALLRQLPILRSDDIGLLPDGGALGAVRQTVFNIDEVFGASSADAITLHDGRQTLDGFVLGGYLADGLLTVGDELVLGPFLAKIGHLATSNATSVPTKYVVTEGSDSAPSTPRGIGVPSDPSSASATPFWCTVRVVSIRDRRLPVQRLETDHYGTAGVVFTDDCAHIDVSTHVDVSKIRKGMVMTHPLQSPPSAYHGFTAAFAAQHSTRFSLGVSVAVYINSIRASATVTSISVDSTEASNSMQAVFYFTSSYEFFRCNDRVLILPDKVDNGAIGLGGVMGTIMEGLQ